MYARIFSVHSLFWVHHWMHNVVSWTLSNTVQQHNSECSALAWHRTEPTSHRFKTLPPTVHGDGWNGSPICISIHSQKELRCRSSWERLAGQWRNPSCQGYWHTGMGGYLDGTTWSRRGNLQPHEVTNSSLWARTFYRPESSGWRSFRHQAGMRRLGRYLCCYMPRNRSNGSNVQE